MLLIKFYWNQIIGKWYEIETPTEFNRYINIFVYICLWIESIVKLYVKKFKKQVHIIRLFRFKEKNLCWSSWWKELRIKV